MAHPETVTLAERRKLDHLSPLMRAKMRSQKNETVNFCPYGCELRELDEHGYCRHLVGFTNDGKTYERMVWRGRRRVVEPRHEKVEETALTANVLDAGERGEAPIRWIYEDVLPTDRLVRITISSRVYRDVDGAGEKLAIKEAAAKKAEQEEQRRLLLEDMLTDPDFLKQVKASIDLKVG